MAYIEWKKEFSVAVKAFNDDHKQLVSYLNQLHDALQSGIGISDMSFILKGLVEYTQKHFAREEKLMLKYNYPEYEEHKKEHQELLKEVGEFYSDFLAGKKAFTFALLEFLNNWVTNHILGSDMRYKPFFIEIAKKQKED